MKAFQFVSGAAIWSAVAVGPVVAQCLQWSPEFTSGPSDEQVLSLGACNGAPVAGLYAGGVFQQMSNGVQAKHVARWTGTSWAPLGTGTSGPVYALTEYDDPLHGPVLIAGGAFGQAGGITAYTIARWNGTSWSKLPSAGGAGLAPAAVRCLLADGPRLYIGGNFDGSVPPSPVASDNVILWNGTNWVSLGGGVGNGETFAVVNALAILDHGSGPALYAGGQFNSAGGIPVRNLAKWDGTVWSPVGTPPWDGVDIAILDIIAVDVGDGPALYVACADEAGGIPVNRVAKWDGFTWSNVGQGFGSTPTALTAFDDGSGPALYAVGNFYQSPAHHVAKWDGSTWSALGAGIPQQGGLIKVHAATAWNHPNGERELYVGGWFSIAGALTSWRVAGWKACAQPIESFCAGDASLAACPCQNWGLPGHGCENSAQTGGALLSFSGATEPDTLAFQASGETPNALSIFLQGDQLVSASAAFGDGLRCAGGNVKRLYVKAAVGGAAQAPEPGDPAVGARSAELGDPLAAGSTRYYQTWYRDALEHHCPAPSGATSNVTNGVRVVW